MSKYNLIDLLEGMSNDEFEAAKEADRLEAHPDKDKIKAILALIAKEKEKIVKQGGIKEIGSMGYSIIDQSIDRRLLHQFLLKFNEIYEDMVEAGDEFYVLDVIQYLNMQLQDFADDTKMGEGEIDESNSIKEIGGQDYNRIDGLINRRLLQQFLLKFSEIYEDMVETGGEYDVIDVLQYLNMQMQEFADDTKMGEDERDEEDLDESTGPSDKSEPEDDVDNVDTLASPDAKGRGYDSAVKATSDQDNEEERDDAGVPPMYTENKDEIAKLQKIADDTSKMPKERDEARNKMYDLKRQKESMSSADDDLVKKLSQVMFKLQNDPQEYVKLYMDSVARDIKRGGDYIYDEMSVEDMIEDYQNYIADRSMAELKAHFGRFMKDFQ
jgi:hypothetical protein